MRTARWQVPFRDEHQNDVALGSETGDVLGNDSPAVSPGSGRHLRVRSAPQASLGDMDRVVIVLIAEQAGRGCREHLVDEEANHASSAWRC